MRKRFYFVLFLLLAWLRPGSLQAQTATPTPDCCRGIAALTGFNKPEGARIDLAHNRLYVGDRLNNTVHIFDSSGTPITIFGSWGTGSFNNPADISFDSQGNLYVADFSSQTIEKFDTNLQLITTFQTNPLDYPRSLFVENTGNTTTAVYIVGQSGWAYRFDGAGSVYSQAATFGGPATLNTPTGIVKAGNMVYVTSQNTNQIFAFDESNNYAATVVANLTFATYLATDLAGDFYATGNNQVNVYKPDFSFDHACPIPNYPWGVAVNGQGQLFVAEDNSTAVTVIQGCVAEPTLTPTPFPLTNAPDQGECYIFPSPVRGDQANLAYQMSESGSSDIEFFNESMERVMQITLRQGAGIHTTTFSVTSLVPGVYFYRVFLSYDSGRSEKIKWGKFVRTWQ